MLTPTTDHCKQQNAYFTGKVKPQLTTSHILPNMLIYNIFSDMILPCKKNEKLMASKTFSSPAYISVCRTSNVFINKGPI